ncbi:MAG: PHP domain-containing protein [Chitinivibrionales bacterium]|nr:PHP domain-containing protein [Chitinivibrionales bacterium]MBD3357102.1 PHP domain-containing protein [Chitinivibrionales bacterium]
MSSQTVSGTKNYVDLHIHSSYSDGTYSVRDIIEAAGQKGLRAISVTDHDSIDGYPLAQELGDGLGLEVIPGVELSSEIEGIDIHILGYFIDIHDSSLKSKLREMKDARYVRAQKMVRNLNDMGVDLRFETVLKIAGEGAIGRPHIAAAMLKEELVYSFKEAFDKHIGYDSPAYVEKLQMEPREVFALIRDAGGIPILAHPGVTKVDERLSEFVKDGLLGIEAYHSEHNVRQQRYYRNYSTRRGLIITGGSDFHSGSQSKTEIGGPRVPYSVVEVLKEAHTRFLKGQTL